ncbi:MAG TPA: 3-hydroxybutyrate dehydrogenase [Ktedonobacterales bacterium]|nr:3-hydroxybutyrate dehydrogenase [Ktedonobacterales bacterium]
MDGIAGKVAIVTGAASGIGLAVARELARRGARVTLADVDTEAGERVARELAGARFQRADLTSAEECRRLVAETAAATEGRVDILINNAGIQHVAPIPEFPEAKWRQMLDLMLTAPFLLTQAALPGMYARGWGRIVNVGSVHSLRASAFKSAYVVAKHGLLGLTRVTALEGAEHGVTCNCVCPSYVRTALVEKQIADQARIHGIPESEVVETIMVAEAPIHRLLEPSEVAAYVGFLCSDAGAGITGGAQLIDCGWTAH